MTAQLHDQHLHSRHSVDSKADPAANCQQALATGLTGLTFTEHYDPHPAEWKRCKWDYAAIHDTVASLRERFAPDLEIGLGIEVDYQPQMLDAIIDYLDRHDFDVVLLSIHWAADRQLHLRRKWKGAGAAEMTAAYEATLLDASQRLRRYAEQGERPFDVIGHLDLVARYQQQFWQQVVPMDAGAVDEALQQLIEAGVVPEANTSGIRQGLGRTLPEPSVLGRYRELGGRFVSLGSDAHLAQHVGAGIAETAQALAAVGIEGEAVYRDRVQTIIPF